MAKPVILVTAAVMMRRGRILIARRADHGHINGKWEFPGGKLEPGETPEQCLARELFEEFGIRATVGPLIAENCHDYGEKAIRLLVFRITRIRGDFVPVEHDAIEWVRPAELLSYDLAPADIPVAKLLSTAKKKN